MKKKEKAIKNSEKIQSSYGIWKQYNDFIRQLYLEKPIRKPTGKEIAWKFLKKLIVVYFGAFFTTLTFYFFIDPNGLYNSGLNGLLQAFSKFLIGYNKVRWENYYSLYYGLGLFCNLVFIIVLKFLFDADLEIISTSIFYVLSQIAWTKIFNLTGVRKYIFNRLNPSSWQSIGSGSQLSFTLPYYIVIAITASIIHTFGYSLIFQAQATPGGFDVISSHFSSQKKKKKSSVGFFMKTLGIFVILFLTMINFSWLEDKTVMKKSSIQKEIMERDEKKMYEGKDVDEIIEEWKQNMYAAKRGLENGKDPNLIANILERNGWLTEIFIKRTRNTQIAKYPKEIDYYLEQDKKTRNEKIKEEIESIEKEIKEKEIKGERLKECIERKIYLRKKIAEKKENFFLAYLQYSTNDEKLWATVVYILASSFFISKIFPRDQIVMLQLYSQNEEERNKAINILEKFSPVFYNVYMKKEGEEKSIFVTSCYLSRWNLYLLKPYLQQVGKITINESK